MNPFRLAPRGLASAAFTVSALAVAAPAHAQLGVDAGYYTAQSESYFILNAGSTRRLGNPLALGIYGTWMTPLDHGGGDLFGAGVDLSLWRGGNPGAYAVGGVSGGFGVSGADAFWGSYSIGVGYDLRLFSTVGLGVEARWRGLTQGGEEGVQMGVRLGLGMRRKSSPPASSTGTTTSAAAPPAAPPPPGLTGTPLANAVVETALGAMGAPYTWGGSSTNGFDCSGLIQYAYSAHGIPLPRTSSLQAQQGVSVGRDLALLAPGDILTFSSNAGGSQVSHVGLYLGNGEFIHSATNGVQKSRLSATDPYGKWWWNRWVGARRVLPS